MTGNGVRGLVEFLGTQPNNAVGLRDAVVTGVTASGTVNLDMQGVLVDEVPCLSSYLERAIDDVVAVLVVQGRMLVIGAIGVERPPVVDIPPTTIRWGSAAPAGGGWARDAGGTVYARTRELYVRTVAATEPADPDPETPPEAPTPRPVTIEPTDQAAYRDNRRNTSEGTPIQGAWYSYPHPYTGAWFYGTKIAAACSGKTVSRMDMRICRQGRGGGGVYGGATARLYLHSATSKGSAPPDLNTPWVPTDLSPSEVTWVRMPQSWVNALASGSARGVGCYAGVGEDYLSYGNCGEIKITFS